MIIKFEVPGRPVPYTRTTKRQKYVDEQYQRYHAYKEAVATYARNYMALNKIPKIKKGVPLEFGCKVYLKKGKKDGDLSNYVKGLEDALNKVVFADDKWIWRLSDTEKIFILGPDEQERVEIEVREIENAGA